jgi:hypothetical protein
MIIARSWASVCVLLNAENVTCVPLRRLINVTAFCLGSERLRSLTRLEARIVVRLELRCRCAVAFGSEGESFQFLV